VAALIVSWSPMISGRIDLKSEFDPNSKR